MLSFLLVSAGARAAVKAESLAAYAKPLEVGLQIGSEVKGSRGLSARIGNTQPWKNLLCEHPRA